MSVMVFHAFVLHTRFLKGIETSMISEIKELKNKNSSS